MGGPFYFPLLFILLRKLASPFSFGLTPTVGFRLVLCSSGPQEAHESELSLSVTWTEDDRIEGSAAYFCLSFVADGVRFWNFWGSFRSGDPTCFFSMDERCVEKAGVMPVALRRGVWEFSGLLCLFSMPRLTFGMLGGARSRLLQAQVPRLWYSRLRHDSRSGICRSLDMHRGTYCGCRMPGGCDMVRGGGSCLSPLPISSVESITSPLFVLLKVTLLVSCAFFSSSSSSSLVCSVMM